MRFRNYYSGCLAPSLGHERAAEHMQRDPEVTIYFILRAIRARRLSRKRKSRLRTP